MKYWSFLPFFILLHIRLIFSLTANDIVNLTILQTTDMHGHVGVLDGTPGMPRVASVIESERADAGENAFLLIDCGDTGQGTLAMTFDNGLSVFEAMNAMKYDVWVPGNHDFDYGIPQLVKFAHAVRFNKVAANIEIEGNEKLFKPWVMINKNSLKIAVIGIVPEYLPQWIATAQLKKLRQFDIEQSIAKYIPEIMKASPDIIILAIHSGEFTSARLNPDGKRHSLTDITTKYPQINLILGGHTHQMVSGKKIYPDSWYVQSGCHTRSVGKITLTYDKSKREIVSLDSYLINPASQEEDTEILKILEPIRQKALATAKEKIARIDYPLEPVSGPRKKNALATLFCRALVDGTEAEMAFHGTLTGFKTEAGIITSYQLFRLAPYENFITLLRLSPSQARAIIEEQENIKAKNSYMMAYGLRYELDADGKVKGELIIESSGKKWDDEKHRITFAFGSYAVSGAGGRFPILRSIVEAEGANRIELDLTVRELLGAFLKKFYPPSR